MFSKSSFFMLIVCVLLGAACSFFKVELIRDSKKLNVLFENITCVSNEQNMYPGKMK